MIKVYYCTQCKREIYSTHLYKNCKICDAPLYRLPTLYEDFTVLNEEERMVYIEKCIEEIKIKEEKRAQRKKKQEENRKEKERK